jgi:hypothetical protein
MKNATKQSTLRQGLQAMTEKPKREPVEGSANGGKVTIAGHFSPEVKSALMLCRIKAGNKTLAHIMGLAFNRICAEHGVPEAYSE